MSRKVISDIKPTHMDISIARLLQNLFHISFQMTMTSKSFISFLSQKRKSAHGNKRKVKTLVSKSRTALPLFAWQWIEMTAAGARMKLFVSLSPPFNPIYCCRCCQLLCEKFAFGSFNLNNIAAASQPPLEVFFQGVHTSRTVTINADKREVEDDCLKGAVRFP